MMNSKRKRTTKKRTPDKKDGRRERDLKKLKKKTNERKCENGKGKGREKTKTKKGRDVTRITMLKRERIPLHKASSIWNRLVLSGKTCRSDFQIPMV